MAYRCWCGECAFRTPWLSESQAETRQIQHYAERHPGLEPGGHVEVSRRSPNGGTGCLRVVGILVLLLILAAACRQWYGN